MITDRLPVLLIEDDEQHCAEYKNYISTLDDVHLVGITNSSDEGLNLTKTYLPEVVILDLELNEGNGSGIDYLNLLQKIQLTVRPCIIVITNSKDRIIYKYVRENGATFTIFKGKKDYSAEYVINTIKTLRPTILEVNKGGDRNTIVTAESPEEIKQKIYSKIIREMELIGISSKYSGKNYLVDAVYLLLTENDRMFARKIYQEIAKKYKKTEQAITHAMQTAITAAWRTVPIDDLFNLYTARVNPQTGVPTITEFIYYYVEKINGSLK